MPRTFPNSMLWDYWVQCRRLFCGGVLCDSLWDAPRGSCQCAQRSYPAKDLFQNGTTEKVTNLKQPTLASKSTGQQKSPSHLWRTCQGVRVRVEVSVLQVVWIVHCIYEAGSCSFKSRVLRIPGGDWLLPWVSQCHCDGQLWWSTREDLESSKRQAWRTTYEGMSRSISRKKSLPRVGRSCTACLSIHLAGKCICFAVLLALPSSTVMRAQILGLHAHPKDQQLSRNLPFFWDSFRLYRHPVMWTEDLLFSQPVNYTGPTRKQFQ
jgi:hypothetical protein